MGRMSLDIRGAARSAGTLTLTWSVAVALVVLAGCDSGPKKYSVTGKVTYQGNALPTGTVFFLPDQGPSTLTTISTDGVYHLEAPAGRYRVGVTAVPEPPPGVSPESESYDAPPPLIPRSFARPDSSGIVVEVKPQNGNAIDLELE